MLRRIRMWLKSIKINTNFDTLITLKKEPIRFESWKDAITYIGKYVTFCPVESPNVTDRLMGINVSVNLDGEITNGLLLIGGNKVDYWRCRPAKKHEIRNNIDKSISSLGDNVMEMKTHILTIIFLLAFIGICFWANFHSQSFLSIMLGIATVAFLTFIYTIFHGIFKDIFENQNDNNDDRYL